MCKIRGFATSLNGQLIRKMRNSLNSEHSVKDLPLASIKVVRKGDRVFVEGEVRPEHAVTQAAHIAATKFEQDIKLLVVAD